jgi:hypothetical protein
MIMQVDVEWPTDLPLPLLDYSGSPANRTLTSQPSEAVRVARSRFQRTNAAISVSWNFTEAEYSSFKAFFDATLGNGCAQFSLSLRYPLNSDLTEWLVRFVGDYQSEYLDGTWGVKANLDVVNPVVF